MAKVEVVSGSILDAKEQYIVHQANCISSYSRGLAAQIFQKWPETNIYSTTTTTNSGTVPGTVRVPGTIIVRNNVIALLAQKYPGRATRTDDSSAQRLLWFRQCLQFVSKLKPETIAVPYNIGCGLAGGLWKDYWAEIKIWAHSLPLGTIVRVYQHQ